MIPTTKIWLAWPFVLELLVWQRPFSRYKFLNSTLNWTFVAVIGQAEEGFLRCLLDGTINQSEIKVNPSWERNKDCEDWVWAGCESRGLWDESCDSRLNVPTCESDCRDCDWEKIFGTRRWEADWDSLGWFGCRRPLNLWSMDRHIRVTTSHWIPVLYCWINFS